ncbi:MAG TPA: tyrosine--tRNA ligase [Bacillota bacterium]|nr:tyrosine--tRNA ligase [Bacillota bacterium]HPJ85621.1 tyrosine--tRNA ligase [Bacillota bacterium]HPQ61427.1 tyrosine--tRNA ligase [Bacillota bacterium]
MSLFSDLKWRDLAYDQTDPNLEKILDEKKLTFYIGIDPTADSLHIGHLLACLVAKRLQNHGHHPIIVLGGGTGLIGDPSFKNQERQLLSIQTSLDNAEGIRKQIIRLLPDAQVVNNYDWISSLNTIEFLRDIGKNFNISYMINKESVRSRIENGLSFTEFAYQIIQAWDFEHLYASYGCKLQIGGQDQWGNITSGLELIRKLHGADSEAYGFTFPLVTKSDGTKFGKTESGTLWLDKEKTSPYEFYQFWINTADDDAINYLKKYTFLSKDEIEKIELSVKMEPETRMAQKELARQITTLVHGENECLRAERITDALFTGKIHTLDAEEIGIGFKNLIKYETDKTETIDDVLVNCQLASSKRQARELVTSGAITINGEKVTDTYYMADSNQAIGKMYTVLRKGKKTYAIVKHL